MTGLGRTGCAAVALLGLALGAAAQPTTDPLSALQVFVGLAQRPGDAERGAYLKAHAGSAVDGTGLVEVVLPRTYFDTSVPATNPAVALIHVGPGRKVACGLPLALSPEELKRFREGSSVAFRGHLVDGIPWGEWTTLYLGNCQLQSR